MNDSKIISIGQIEVDATKFVNDPDENDLILLCTRDLVLFPGVTFPVQLGREASIAAATRANELHIPLGVICQRNSEIESPRVPDDLIKYGVIADVMRVLEIPGGYKTAILHARDRFAIRSKVPSDDGIPHASVRVLKETKPRTSDPEFQALVNELRMSAVRLFHQPEASAEMIAGIESIDDPVMLINMLATQMSFPIEFKQHLLAQRGSRQRAFLMLPQMARNEELMQITTEIRQKAKEGMSEQQRTAFLQQQMESIRQELYGDDDDAAKLKAKAKKIKLSKEARETFDREVDKLSRLHPQSPDYSVLYSYLELILSLPWGKTDPLNNDLKKAETILNSEHYGLEKVKERIMEQLAVMMHNTAYKSTILCLVGPPGVGKTSLGQSIASALGRQYQRVSVGGLHDEAEIRGHRRTYIGAMPGRIIDALRRAGTSNPVIVIDEIDKMGSDVKSDPQAAMLEVLDPEQNSHFHDNYVDVDFDLSKVLFICTANTLSTISQALLDRMEVIEISGYLPEEKTEIAKRHLLPRALNDVGIKSDDLDLPADTVAAIIDGYTSESGVRQLEKHIRSIARKSVLQYMRGEGWPQSIDPSKIGSYLGVAHHTSDRYEGNAYAGVVTGLAWTAAGGEILFIEATPIHGKGEKLTLTGSLGDVMKESAMIALQYVRTHAAELGIDPSVFDSYSLHLHVPEGAIPKDGPSAGITMATAFVSALTRRRVAERVAMTGEITLRGKVLPVGGIKEKILAARRATINRIILSDTNRKDVEEIPEVYREGLTFVYVNDASEAIAAALTQELVDDLIPIPDKTK